MKKIILALAISAVVLMGQMAFQQAGSLVIPGSLSPGAVIQTELITGKPYSATVKTRSEQMLAGHESLKVENTETGLVYRDAQGRTRTDYIGRYFDGQVRPELTRVVITDPVAGLQYDLTVPEPDVPVGGRGGVGGRGAGRGGGEGSYSTRPLQPSQQISQSGASPYQLALQEESNRRKKGSVQRTVDDLATRTINGVTAQGVRITVTIPVQGVVLEQFGLIGKSPMSTVTERWVSTDLGVVVKSVYSDPRFGSTSYDLTDIKLAPPDPSLFVVPAGVRELPGKGRRGGNSQGTILNVCKGFSCTPVAIPPKVAK